MQKSMSHCVMTPSGYSIVLELRQGVFFLTKCRGKNSNTFSFTAINFTRLKGTITSVFARDLIGATAICTGTEMCLVIVIQKEKLMCDL